MIIIEDIRQELYGLYHEQVPYAIIGILNIIHKKMLQTDQAEIELSNGDILI